MEIQAGIIHNSGPEMQSHSLTAYDKNQTPAEPLAEEEALVLQVGSCVW